MIDDRDVWQAATVLLVKRYRDDKTSAEADTFATIQSMYQRASGQPPPIR